MPTLFENSGSARPALASGLSLLGWVGMAKPWPTTSPIARSPRFLRPGWPLLLDQERVVWVGGHQIAHSVRITRRSRRVYHLYWEETRQ